MLGMGGFPSFWVRISTFRQVCGKICLCMEVASGPSNWVHRWSFRKAPRTRVVPRHHRLFHGVCMHSAPDTKNVKSSNRCRGVKLVLNIDFESVLSRQLVGKISRRSHRKMGATLEGSAADLLEEADPTLWDAARL